MSKPCGPFSESLFPSCYRSQSFLAQLQLGGADSMTKCVQFFRDQTKPGEGNGNLLQYSCLENPMDRETWQAKVHRVARIRHDLATKPSDPN